VYHWAARKLGRAPGEIMMVAARQYDLNSAAREGFRSAFVHRVTGDATPAPGTVDLVVAGLDALADQLGPRI